MCVCARVCVLPVRSNRDVAPFMGCDCTAGGSPSQLKRVAAVQQRPKLMSRLRHSHNMKGAGAPLFEPHVLLTACRSPLAWHRGLPRAPLLFGPLWTTARLQGRSRQQQRGCSTRP